MVGKETAIAFTVAASALALRVASTETANASYFVIAAYALLGREQAVQALALSWLFSMLSPGIAPESTVASTGRYAVIAGAAVSVLLRSGLAGETFSMSRPVLATLAFGLFVIIHSTLVSPLPVLSMLKGILWTVVMTALLSAWAGLTSQAHARLERQLFVGLTLLVMISLPLAVTDIGYLRNETGFQGLLNHPQAFGLTVACLGAWAAGRLLKTDRPHWLDMTLLGLCVMLAVMSEARTAGLALVLGLACAMLTSPFAACIPGRRLMPGLFNPRLQAFAVAAVISVVVAGPDWFANYLVKRSDAANIAEAAAASRGALVFAMVANIEANPLAGIGFGIASDPASMEVDHDPVFGLPTSAPIEKGVLPLAVLEELGILGFLLVAGWLWPIIRRGARAGVTPFAVLATLLFTNLGESTLFSPGGMGLLPLILLAWAVTRACARSHS